MSKQQPRGLMEGQEHKFDIHGTEVKVGDTLTLLGYPLYKVEQVLADSLICTWIDVNPEYETLTRQEVFTAYPFVVLQKGVE